MPTGEEILIPVIDMLLADDWQGPSAGCPPAAGRPRWWWSSRWGRRSGGG
ncbi:hypothetical protein LADH09A_001888 [Micromonospora sp. LAH09]|nr:hypothetical protein [Micromonospora cabrerizensis]MCG5468031.1 hypothetical protein [Micromonospora cabrerizensis]